MDINGLIKENALNYIEILTRISGLLISYRVLDSQGTQAWGQSMLAMYIYYKTLVLFTILILRDYRL